MPAPNAGVLQKGCSPISPRIQQLPVHIALHCQGWRGCSGQQTCDSYPQPGQKSATSDPWPRATGALSGSQPPDRGAPLGARHSHTMHSTPCTNYVRKLSVYHGPACFVSSVHNYLTNISSTNLSDDTADLFCKVCCTDSEGGLNRSFKCVPGDIGLVVLSAGPASHGGVGGKPSNPPRGAEPDSEGATTR